MPSPTASSNDVPERVMNVDGVYYNVGAEGTLQRIPDAGPSKTAAAMMVPVKRRQRVLDSLRDLAAQLQDALVEPVEKSRQEEGLMDALEIERR